MEKLCENPGGGNSKHNSPEVGISLSFSRNGKKASVGGEDGRKKEPLRKGQEGSGHGVK